MNDAIPQSKPKPDVLERLGELKAILGTERLPVVTVNVADLHEDVTDAIAEIERKNAWQEVAMQEIHDLAAKLRAIREAEPVRLSFPEDDIALIRGVPNSDDYWDNHDFCRIADMMEKYDLVPRGDTE